jgi:hypothetical protein
MNDNNKESLVYEVLGLKPFWVETQSKDKPSNQTDSEGKKYSSKKKYLLKEVKINNQSCLFIAPYSFMTSLASLEHKLFEKISGFISTIGDPDKKESQMIEATVIKNEINLCDFVFFLEQDLQGEIKEIVTTKPFMTSVSLKEVIEKPEKKRKLWQDIKELIKVIKK